MTLDLSTLDQPLHSGRPLQLALAIIDEDPNQPRKVFLPEALARMAESIRRRGVRSPVSVRPHPTEPGRFMLNHGARRYRGSAMAGKETIPAIIDETHIDYDQIIENLQRDDLKAMELAEFIGRKIKSGDKKALIARQLGIDASIVTQHLALIDPPDCIRQVYASGRCQSPKTLYDLRMLFEAYPQDVSAWCTTAPEITRRSVAGLGDRLKSTGAAKRHRHEPTPANVSRSPPPARNRDKALQEIDLSMEQPATSAIPEVWVEVDGRTALLVLDRHPMEASLVYLRFGGSGAVEPVRAGDCRLLQLKWA